MRRVKSVVCVLAVLASFAFFACENDDSSEKPYGVFFTLGGESYSFTKGFTDPDVDVIAFGYKQGAETQIYATPDCPSGDTEPANYIGIHLDDAVTGDYDQMDGAVYMNITDVGYESVTLTLTVTGYGEIDGVITGSYTGTFTNGGAPVNGKGTFKVKRIEDDAWGS